MKIENIAAGTEEIVTSPSPMLGKLSANNLHLLRENDCLNIYYCVYPSPLRLN